MRHIVAGVEPGQRQLNGPQTTGREYRNLSEAGFEMVREDMYDLVEWAATQPWCDDNVGMILRRCNHNRSSLRV